ncbi:MAG TPA: hypothetical protein VGC66_22580 [Pyrinomonadaceae bacterium]|jgi:hypothetical protein
MSAISAKNVSARAIKASVVMSSLFLFLFMQGCSDVHSLVWNKAEATIDGHQIVIRPCRNSYTRTESDTPTNRQHVFGCGDDVKVEIRNEALMVNGKSYGMLNRGDSVEVKHDKVFINAKESGTIARK